MKFRFSIFAAIFFLACNIFAQNINIVPALKQVESGDINSARKLLQEFKKQAPKNPSVLFLDAVLTENGEDALYKYEMMYKNHPKSKYADAAIFRIFSYYFSLGIYKKAESYKQLLLKQYPNSAYIKSVDRTIPDIEINNPELPVSEKTESMSKKNFIFTVQAGAFLNIENAKKLKNQIATKGYDSKITPKDVGGSILNVVTAGSFTSQESAKKFLIWLKSNFNINGRIVPKN